MSYPYPIAPSEPQIDIYHGDTIIDPFRNFENLEDSIVLKWMKQQTQLTDSVLGHLQGRNILQNYQKEYDKKNPFQLRAVKGTANGKWFYRKRSSSEKVYKLYHKNSKDTTDILLFDPQEYTDSKQENGYKISHHQPSWDGEQIAISLVKNGNEIGRTIFVDVKSKTIMPKFASNSAPALSGGILWTPDNNNVLYIKHQHLDEKSVSYTLDLSNHAFNIKKGTSIDVLSNKNNSELGLAREDYPRILSFDENDSYIIAQGSGSGSFKKTFVSPTGDFKNLKWELLYDESAMIKSPRIKNDSIYFIALSESTNGKICKTSLSNPNFNTPEVLVPEDEDAIITSYRLVGDDLVYVKQRNGIVSRLFHKTSKRISEIKLPQRAGKINISTQNKYAKKVRISYNGWTTPIKKVNYDLDTGIFEEDEINPTLPIAAFEDFIVEEVDVSSHDGVLVPLSLIYHKNLKRDGTNPVLLLNYGAYGTSVTPFFLPFILNWVRDGGVLALSHVRGGGEKGDAWHKEGMKENKSNSWKDAIACTEYLIDQNYTSKTKSAIWGSSAGGIVAAMAITERPDLYKAAIFESPAINMLRCEIQPNGPNSIKEFGTVTKKSEYDALLKMDAYHHIKEGVEYPAVLVFSGLKDGRVAAWDPAKFVARLQTEGAKTNPILLDMDFNSGHYISNDEDKDPFAVYTKGLSFAFWQTGHPDYQPENVEK